MTRHCLNCGKEFTPRKDHLERGFGFYCSRACHYAHKRSLPPKDYREHFWAKVDKNGPLWNGTPCWIWTGAKDKAGYGRFHLPRGGNVPAYWVAWELLHGQIDKALQFDHLCRNHPCVNAEHHLEPVTQKVNLLRGEGFAAINAQKTHCKRGHEFTPENTYMQQDWRECVRCRIIHTLARKLCQYARFGELRMVV